jgi:hypothetical protein
MTCVQIIVLNGGDYAWLPPDKHNTIIAQREISRHWLN